jgi:hypothetical protein
MKSNLTTLDQFKDKNYGKPGTAKRDQLDAGYENFKIGATGKGIDPRRTR